MYFSKLKMRFLALFLFVAMIFSACVVATNPPGKGNPPGAKPKSLTPGAIVKFVLAGGAPYDATVISPNNDGIAGGIDLNGDGIPELVYLDTTPPVFALDQDGDGVADFYLIEDANGGVKLVPNSDGTGNERRLVHDGSKFTGIDDNGDQTPDDPTLGNIAADVGPPTVSADTADGTYFTGQSVTLTCVDDIACNAISYTLDGSAPDFAGSGKVKMGKTAIVTFNQTGSYTLRFIARDANGNTSAVISAAYQIAAPGSDVTLPVAGNAGALTVTGKTLDSLSISWTAATDNITAQSSIQYLVYYSLLDNISTVVDAETNGTPVGSYTAAITSAQITGLSANTAYFITVVAKDEGNNKVQYGVYSFSTCASALLCGELALTPSVSILAGTISTNGYVDAIGTSAKFKFPNGLASDGTNIYVADNMNHVVRKIVIATGEVSTLAGAGVSGYVNAIGPAARFEGPRGVATDGTFVYVTEYSGHRVRKIEISTGAVTTVAGSMSGSIGTTNAIGTNARFHTPCDIVVVGGNLYVADYLNHSIRKIVISTSSVTTFAGLNGTSGLTNATGSSARFWGPQALTTDGTFLYTGEILNETVRKIEISTATVSAVAGPESSGAVASGYTNATGASARFNDPNGMTTDGTNLYVADYVNSVVRKIVLSTRVVSTLSDGSGAGIPAFSGVVGIVSDGTSLYVSDHVGQVIKKID